MDVTIAAVATAWPPEELAALRRQGVRVLTTPFGWGRTAWLGKLQAVGTWPILVRRSFDTLYCHGHGRMHRWMHRFLRPGGACVYHEILDFADGKAPTVVEPTDFIVANSRPVAANWRRQHAENRIRVLPFLTSRSAVPPPGPRAPVGDRELRVAYLGRLVTHKQPDWLVEDWPTIARDAPLGQARLDIYGTDPDSDILLRLRESVANRNLQHRIELHGEYRIDDIPAIMSRTDLVVLPSRYEGLPLVLVEAMMHGVPFVAMNAGGTADLENPDVEIVSIDNSEFVRGLERMAARLRSGQIDAGRLYTWADERFGYDSVANRWCAALMDPHGFFGETELHSLMAG